MIPDTEITRVMAATGMAPMQAYYHVQGRELARQLDERKRRVGGL